MGNLHLQSSCLQFTSVRHRVDDSVLLFPPFDRSVINYQYWFWKPRRPRQLITSQTRCVRDTISWSSVSWPMTASVNPRLCKYSRRGEMKDNINEGGTDASKWCVVIGGERGTSSQWVFVGGSAELSFVDNARISFSIGMNSSMSETLENQKLQKLN